eukprot:1138848-Pelagomonas_calceolata.AAC.18
METPDFLPSVTLASSRLALAVWYRKPRSSYKYIRPELQQRDAAFKKGGAYLERYCKLIAFAYYLEHVGPESREHVGPEGERVVRSAGYKMKD